jgi:hypothetical protein
LAKTAEAQKKKTVGGGDVAIETSKLDKELAELDSTIGDSLLSLTGGPGELLDRKRRFKLLLDRKSGLGRAFNPSDFKGEAIGWETQDAKGATANGRLPLPVDEEDGSPGAFV